MKTILVKIGGLVAQDEKTLHLLLKEIKELSSNYHFVLVHGGGKEVTAVSDKFGYTAEFQNGVRITSPGEMDVVDMVLGGKLNIALVRKAQTLGIKAVGLGGQDGGTFLAQALTIPGRPNCRTGEVTTSNPELINTLLKSGFLPIIHSTSMDESGTGLNINADEAAQAIAMAQKVHVLVYVSDIPGVLKAGEVIPHLNGQSIKKEINEGVISGGMIPKVNNALAALNGGVGAVVIGGYQASGDLRKLLTSEAGTTIKE